MPAPKHIYKRDCEDCEKRYQPTGRSQIICPKCKKKRRAELTLRLMKLNEKIIIGVKE